jgi:hypothetical protein
MSLRTVTTKIFKSAVRAAQENQSVLRWFKMDNKKLSREGGTAYRRNFVKHSSA